MRPRLFVALLPLGAVLLLASCGPKVIPATLSGTCYEWSVDVAHGGQGPDNAYYLRTDAVGLLVISPAVDGKTLIATDARGNLPSLELVPGTSYTVKPLFFDSLAESKTPTEGEDWAVQFRFQTPVSLALLYMNCSNALLNDAAERVGIATGINRAVAASSVSATLAPRSMLALDSFLFLPEVQSLPPAGLLPLPTYLGPVPAPLKLLRWVDDPGRGLLADPAATAFYGAASPGLTGLTYDDVYLEQDETLRLSSISNPYELGRANLEDPQGSNDPLLLLEELFRTGGALNRSNYSDTAPGTGTDALMDAARAARASGNATAYANALVALANQLAAAMPAVPVYWEARP